MPTKHISITANSHHDAAHIALPNCLIEIRHKLTDEAGKPVVSIEIIAREGVGPDQIKVIRSGF